MRFTIRRWHGPRFVTADVRRMVDRGSFYVGRIAAVTSESSEPATWEARGVQNQELGVHRTALRACRVIIETYLAQEAVEILRWGR